ncbi:MAG: glycoside hydrolase family 25 protein [Lachnospiraceae bacterium]|nr:glycoside hydrolase family 25 protein [Lachnospiraceae bacterium]
MNYNIKKLGKLIFSLLIICSLSINIFSAGTSARTMKFLDAAGKKHKFTIDEKANMTLFKKSEFKLLNKKMHLRKSGYTYEHGVDVSKYQGNVNWKKVRKAGYSFAFIRMGFRGYSSGSLNLDSYAIKNLRGAKKAGLKVGIYFFSQAINPKEARAEARYAIKHLGNIKLNLPIVYDPETILNSAARTNKLKKKVLTKNTRAFINYVRKKGYKGMLYCNLKWEAYKLKMSKLKDIPIWYADYELRPQTPYRFTYWQYSSTTKVPGVSGNCDVNIRIIKKK